jgi:hypothetical protein
VEAKSIHILIGLGNKKCESSVMERNNYESTALKRWKYNIKMYV